MTKSKGLGDSIEKALKATGIDKVQGSTIIGEQQAVLVKLYNKVFNENKKPSSCGSCVQQTLSKLKKVYENSCKLD